ncbi:hypothetical protein ACPPVO_34550 [Dactylosporangium sp. McL0621]|uniref:hypothetical protein n=1 Tax=Dactylosporangium sp. McL0621 TaxID=3415678 RepID=UPI003CEF36D2
MTTDAKLVRALQVTLGIGIVTLIGFAIVATFWTTVDGGEFKYAADYWYTAAGVPIALVGIVHAFVVHRLQHGRDGRLGAVGTWLNAAACTVLAAQCAASALAGAEQRWGPTYLLCSALTLVALALLAAGSWRTGLLPRWVLGVWPMVWLLGSFFAIGPGPLLLVALYIAFLVVLPRRVAEHAQRRGDSLPATAVR